MIKTILFRYTGTVFQFVLLSVIAKNSTPNEYGLYLLCLSVALSFYYVIGVGSSEAAVLKLPILTGDGKETQVNSIIGAVLGTAILTASVLMLLLIFITIFTDNNRYWNAFSFTLLFTATNGLIFNISQLLLGIGRTSLGSFFFYPALNTFLLIFILPVVYFFGSVSFNQFAITASIASLIASIVSVNTLVLSVPKFKFIWSLKVAKQLVSTGIYLTTARILHVFSFWIPTMITGYVLAPTEAGIVGTAGRLAIAVSAVIAALRFVVRPALARAHAAGDLVFVKKMCRSLAFMYVLLAITASVLNLLFGNIIIVNFFGEAYLPVKTMLSVLLISVLAEGVFGPVDELLKIDGQESTVIKIYALYIPIFILFSIIVAMIDWMLIPWVQVAYVFAVFLSLNIALFRSQGFVIYPQWPSLKVLKAIN